MYEEFFEMSSTPFTRTIPVEMLYHDRDTEEIYNRLIYAAQRQLFAVLIGDSGAGKTTMLRRLKESLENSECTVLYLADSKLTPRHFYNGLLEQMGCEGKFYRGDARKLLHKQVSIMRGVEHRKLVVIVDEGHLLDKDMLEEIRFLLNYKMDSENPLALIISGQTELWDKLRRQAYRAIFSEDALKRIFDFSAGTPRLINRACSQSLIYAYQNRRAIIDDRMVQIVLEGEVT